MLQEYKDSFPKVFEEAYDEIMNKDICNLAKDIFNSNLNETNIECKNFISNSTGFVNKYIIK